MHRATEIMREQLEKINFNNTNNSLISNVTAEEIKNKDEEE